MSDLHQGAARPELAVPHRRDAVIPEHNLVASLEKLAHRHGAAGGAARCKAGSMLGRATASHFGNTRESSSSLRARQHAEARGWA